MKNTGTIKKYPQFVFFVILCCFFVVFSSPLWAQEYTHTVKEGDTLWSVCEKYYGDPDLWPKLWQMNPFITNPHFLRPGDVLTLLEQEPIIEEETVAKEDEGPLEEETMLEMMGVDASGYTTIGAAGFLSRQKVQPWGKIFSSFSSKLMLNKGDGVVVSIDKNRTVNIGDTLTVYQSSGSLLHPITKKKLGYSVSVHGTVVLTKSLPQSHYEGEIIEAFRPIQVNDSVMAHQKVSPCILPISGEKDLLATVVAIKDQNVIAGQRSIVYLDQGFNQGVRRGNFFQVVKIKKIDDPDFKGESFLAILGELLQTSTMAEIYKKYSRKTVLYEHPFGTLLIIESRPNTATALVLSVTEDFPNGAFVKALSWEDPPELVSTMTPCALE